MPEITRVYEKQIHNNTGIFLINIWKKTYFKNFANLKNSDETRHYNIGSKTHNR